MNLTVVSFLLILIVAYSFWREGILTAFCMFINTFVAGLLAFNFFEPVADVLEGYCTGFLEGMEDFLALILLFCAALAGLRWLTNQVVNTMVEYPPLLQQIGAGVFGALTGYLIAGFLVCAMETLPWEESFLSFDSKVAKTADTEGIRRYLPADRVWLALMRRAGLQGFSRGDDSKTATFDYHGLYTQRYARYRRYTDTREAMPYHRELPP